MRRCDTDKERAQRKPHGGEVTRVSETGETESEKRDGDSKRRGIKARTVHEARWKLTTAVITAVWSRTSATVGRRWCTAARGGLRVRFAPSTSGAGSATSGGGANTTTDGTGNALVEANGHCSLAASSKSSKHGTSAAKVRRHEAGCNDTRQLRNDTRHQASRDCGTIPATASKRTDCSSLPGVGVAPRRPSRSSATSCSDKQSPRGRDNNVRGGEAWS
jgi:hypothetical protein